MERRVVAGGDGKAVAVAGHEARGWPGADAPGVNGGGEGREGRREGWCPGAGLLGPSRARGSPLLLMRAQGAPGKQAGRRGRVPGQMRRRTQEGRGPETTRAGAVRRGW